MPNTTPKSVKFAQAKSTTQKPKPTAAPKPTEVTTTRRPVPRPPVREPSEGTKFNFGSFVDSLNSGMMVELESDICRVQLGENPKKTRGEVPENTCQKMNLVKFNQGTGQLI